MDDLLLGNDTFASVASGSRDRLRVTDVLVIRGIHCSRRSFQGSSGCDLYGLAALVRFLLFALFQLFAGRFQLGPDEFLRDAFERGVSGFRYRLKLCQFVLIEF